MPLATTSPMNIVIVGMGYVGITAAACLTSQGHRVIGVDVNADKVERLNRGESPIAEPEVPELLRSAVESGIFAASVATPDLSDTDVVIVCVGTPSSADGSHNMGFIAESARQIAINLGKGNRVTVAFRSTFKPGTMEELIQPIFRDVLGQDYAKRVELVYNPEFLRESSAVKDYFSPPKIVIGTADAGPSANMERLHEGIDSPVFRTRYREAEITKFIDNSWHAVKVAFANEVGRVCAAYGIDADVAHSIFVADTKLNISSYYTRPGGAFGGSCLPKDVRAMQFIAREAGVKVDLIGSLLDTNESHKQFQLARVRNRVQPGASILVAGLAFKANTDDMRESPNLDLVAELTRQGYRVRVYDPAVRSSSLVGQNLGYVMSELPSLASMLIALDEIDSETFDLIVIATAVGDDLAVDGVPVLDIRRIAPDAA